MKYMNGVPANEVKLNIPVNSVLKILKKHANRIDSKNELCRELLKELGDYSRPPEIITMPSFPHQASAMPTALMRTSLFANQPQKKPKELKNQILESYDSIRIECTGEQLNMFDNSVYLEVVRLSQNRQVSETISFNRHSFLRNLGLSGGVKNYEALRKSLQKLKNTTIKILTSKNCNSFNLIEILDWDEESGYWRISIGNTVVSMFSEELSYIDLNVYKSLPTPLSRYLQNYISAGLPGEQEVKVINLMRLSGTTSQLKDFLGKGRGLLKALDEVKAAGLISSYAIRKNKKDEHVVTLDRIAHKNSKRAL